MKYHTPLRLVAIDSEFEDDNAVPVVELQASDMVTRKVPNPVVDSEIIPDTPPPTVTKAAAKPPLVKVPTPPWTHPLNTAPQVRVNSSAPAARRSRPLVSVKVISVMGALGVAGVVVFALLVRNPAPPATPSPVGAAPTPATSVPRPNLPTAPPSAAVVPGTTVAVVPSSTKPVSETIHLKVTAQPIESTLSLDGNVVAGHALNLMVPKDRGIHVISASAPGYIPFNQQVSFGSDVVLTIALRRSYVAPPPRSTSRARPVVVQPKDKVEVPRTPPTPPVKMPPTIEPGMNLEPPVMRSNVKAIDERNPYKL